VGEVTIVGSNTWRSESGEKRRDRRMKAYLDPIDFPLPFSGGHVGSERSTQDSPSLLLAGPLDFLR
jgi:hypothetical protein